MSVKKLAMKVSAANQYIDDIVDNLRQLFITSAVLDRRNTLIGSLISSISSLGQNRVAATLDMRNLDKPESQLVQQYVAVAESPNFTSVQANQMLRLVKDVAFKNKKYFETRDNTKYDRTSLREVVAEFIKKHATALKEAFDRVGIKFTPRVATRDDKANVFDIV